MSHTAGTFTTYTHFKEEVFVRRKNTAWLSRAKDFLPPAEFAAVEAQVLTLQGRKRDLTERGFLPGENHHGRTVSGEIQAMQARIRDVCKEALISYGERTYPDADDPSRAGGNAGAGGNSNGLQSQPPPLAASTNAPITSNRQGVQLPLHANVNSRVPTLQSRTPVLRSQQSRTPVVRSQQSRTPVVRSQQSRTPVLRSQQRRTPVVRSQDGVGNRGPPYQQTRTSGAQMTSARTTSQQQALPVPRTPVSPGQNGPPPPVPSWLSTGALPSSRSSSMMTISTLQDGTGGALSSAVARPSFAPLPSVGQHPRAPTQSLSSKGGLIPPTLRTALNVQRNLVEQTTASAVHQRPFSPFPTLARSVNPWYPVALRCADFSLKSIPAAIVLENYHLVESHGRRTPLFSAWWLNLEMNSGNTVIDLADIDPVILINFAEQFPGSSVVQFAQENRFTRVTRDMKIERDVTEVPLSQLASRPIPNEIYAWFFKKPDGSSAQFLLSGLYNDVIFGLAPSIILERVYQHRPSALVKLPAFQLQNHIIDLGRMKMVNLANTVRFDHCSLHGGKSGLLRSLNNKESRLLFHFAFNSFKGDVWQLERRRVKCRTDVKPSLVIPMVEGGPMAVIVPVVLTNPCLRDLMAQIPNVFVFPCDDPSRPGATTSHAVNIIAVYRIQNPRLDQLFDMAGADLRYNYRRYPTEVKLETKSVFHGTSASAIASICENNFDWRRSEERFGATFGKGCYFGVEFGTSHGYTEPAIPTLSCHGQRGSRRFMFVADVHVGLCFRGTADTKYPPPWKHGLPYDTAVDNLQHPSMYVKFDKDHMIPRLLIEYAVADIDD